MSIKLSAKSLLKEVQNLRKLARGMPDLNSGNLILASIYANGSVDLPRKSSYVYVTPRVLRDLRKDMAELFDYDPEEDEFWSIAKSLTDEWGIEFSDLHSTGVHD